MPEKFFLTFGQSKFNPAQLFLTQGSDLTAQGLENAKLQRFLWSHIHTTNGIGTDKGCRLPAASPAREQQQGQHSRPATEQLVCDHLNTLEK
jgi:hypothetical protein